MSSPHSSFVSTVTAGAAGVAAVSLVALTLLQSDVCSRSILPAEQLSTKRRTEYNYRWTQALEKAKLQFQYFLAGGVSSSGTSSDEEALLRTTLITDEAKIQALVEEILSKKQPTDLRVVRLGKDAQLSATEFFVWLVSSGNTDIVYQLPLTKFTALLAAAFERQVTSTTFCFVSDASANAASHTVVGLVQATKASVDVVPEPLWMACLAAILEYNLLSAQTAETVLFSLCRLEAQVSTASTLLITLPGQATTALLLPLLQKVFPDDRHVFCYTGCMRTVQYAAQHRATHPRAKVPDSLNEALRFSNPVSVTTPIYRTLHKSANVMKPFLSALARLPLTTADTVETWMGAVDAFLMLKEEEKKNGYLPYVFKLDYVQKGSLAKEKDAYWCVVSLLQFVTGSRTRAKDLTEQQIDAALAWLEEDRSQTNNSFPTLPDKKKKLVEEAVFQHKRILLENKTLLDTVQPTQHWTLKQTVKAGCSCCAPEDDEEAEDMGALTDKLAAFKNANKKPVNGGYVDGKTTFAFDPTRFNM